MRRGVTEDSESPEPEPEEEEEEEGMNPEDEYNEIVDTDAEEEEAEEEVATLVTRKRKDVSVTEASKERSGVQKKMRMPGEVPSSGGKGKGKETNKGKERYVSATPQDDDYVYGDGYDDE